MFLVNKLRKPQKALETMAQQAWIKAELRRTARQKRRTMLAQHHQTVQNELSATNLNLTIAEVKALKVTWSRLRGGTGDLRSGSRRVAIHLITKVLNRFLEKEPGLKTLFCTSTFVNVVNERPVSCVATISDHAREITHLIDSIIICLYVDRMDITKTPKLRRVGERHAKLHPFGLTAHVWESLGGALAQALSQQDVVRMYPYTQHAWNVLLASMVDVLQAGFEEACKVQMRRSKTQNALIRQNSIDSLSSFRTRSASPVLRTAKSESRESKTSTSLDRASTVGRPPLIRADAQQEVTPKDKRVSWHKDNSNSLGNRLLPIAYDPGHWKNVGVENRSQAKLERSEALDYGRRKSYKSWNSAGSSDKPEVVCVRKYHSVDVHVPYI